MMSISDRCVAAALFTASLLMSNCSTVGRVMKSSPFVGASLGAAAGATTGAFAGTPDNPIAGSLIGSAIGLATGALIGGIIHWVETKNEKKPESVLGEVLPSGLTEPKLSQPLVQKIWQNDKIEDGKYVQGHYIWVLERGTVWTMP